MTAPTTRIKFENPFVLAPMAGITDMPFRRLMRRMGVGVVISEFVSANGIISKKNPKTNRYLSYHDDERPVGIQLFGGEDNVLAEAAKIVEDRGVDFVDINLGCPVPKVTKKGGGSAWLCRTNDLGAMFRTVRSAIKIPLTIKIRSGWDANAINGKEIVRIAKEEGIEMVAIHGRTRAQGYAGHADWNYISEIARDTTMPIIGNGDIVSGPRAAARLVQSGCFGVMIGRGALKNPWIFQEAVEALNKLKSLEPDDQAELIRAVIEHHKLPPLGDVPEGRHFYERKVKQRQPLPVSFCAEWVRIRADRDPSQLVNLHLSLLRETYPEDRVMFSFRKFLAWYSAGYPGAHQFRKFIFNHPHFPDVVERALEFFDSVKQLGGKAEEMREEAPVLMGGHG